MIPRSGRTTSPQIRQMRKSQMRLRLIVFSILITLLVGGVVAFFYIPQITIETIIVDGENVLKEEEIINIVEKEISGSYLFIIPRRNIFVYPRERIEKALLENTRLSSVKVAFYDFKTIEVVLKERTPTALWCGVEWYEGEDNGRCFFVDETGFIFAKAPDFSGNSFLRIIGGAVSSDQPMGDRVVEESLYKPIIFFKGDVDREVSKISRIYFKGNGIIEFHFDTEGYVIVNGKQDLGVALENLKVLVGSPSFNGKDDAGNLSVEYIDLQNPEKVFYKVKK